MSRSKDWQERDAGERWAPAGQGWIWVFMLPQCGVHFEFWRCRIRKACEVGMMQVGKREAQDTFLVWGKETVVSLQVYERVKDLVGGTVRHDIVLWYSARTGKFNHGCSIKQILGTSMTESQNRAGNSHYSMYFFPKRAHWTRSFGDCICLGKWFRKKWGGNKVEATVSE